MSDHPADLAKADYARGALAPDLDLLRASVEAIDEAILITGPDLDPPGPRIVYANPAFTRMTGYELAEVLDRSPRLLQGPNTSRATLDELRGALKDGRSFRGESINYRKDGTEYRIEWLIAPVRRNGVITHWMSAQRDVTERARIAEKMRLLAREVDHRAKNALAAVQSILQMTPGESVAAYRAAVIGRVSALARAQTLLVEQDWNGASLQALIQGEVAPFRGLGQQVNLDGPPLLLPPTMVQPMSMALHELATNAVQHGALSAPGGRVLITWTVERQGKDTLQLHWREIGGPHIAAPPQRQSFGMRLLDSTLRGQLGGRVALHWEPTGLEGEVVVPLLSVGAPRQAAAFAKRRTGKGSRGRWSQRYAAVSGRGERGSWAT